MVANLVFAFAHLLIYTHSDYLAPPMFDISNINMWKLKMSMYQKTLGFHVHLAITKEFYLGNSKHKKANAQALKALRKSLSKEYLNMISHCDSAFTVWNILTSLKLQLPIQVEKSPTNVASWSNGMTPLRYIWILN